MLIALACKTNTSSKALDSLFNEESHGISGDKDESTADA
jgi:hypothetical protein